MDNTTKIYKNSNINYNIQDHLSDYLAVIIDYRWIVIGCFFLIVGSVILFSLLSNPIYQATAQVMIRAQPSLVNPLGEDTTRGYSENEYFQTQVNLISNRTLAWKVITSLNLKKKIKQNINGEENAIVSEVKQSSQAGHKMEKKATSEQDPDLVDWYLNHLEVVSLPDSNLVNVNFNGNNPRLVANIVNTHTRLAIDQSVQLQKVHAYNTLKWLKDQIMTQKKEVEDAQKKIHNYQKENDLVSVEDRRNLITQELDQINSNLVEARNIRIAKQAAYEQLQKVAYGQAEPLILPEIVDGSMLQNLRSRMVELNVRKVEMSTNYGPKHPKMVQLNQGMDQLKKEMETEISRLKKMIKADLNQAISIEAGLIKTLDQKKNLAMGLGEKNIEYDVLKRQADSSDEIYDFLLKQSKEINLSSVMDTSGVQVVDRAEIPDAPIKPNYMMNIAMAILLGLLFSPCLAFFIEYMDNTIKDSKDISVWLDLPVLAMIPFDKRLNDGETSVLSWKPEENLPQKKHPYPTSYYPINRFPMLFNDHGNSPNGNGRVIVIESATMEEGKTTIAIKAASNMATAGMRVLLVDCDLLRPRLSKILNVCEGIGLTYFLTNILNYTIDVGDLSTCSIADLFFLIGLKKKNGYLVIENNDNQHMGIFFENGNMIHLEYPDNQDSNRLGTMLVNSGMITKAQLEDALVRNKRTGQHIGYILVNGGYLTRDKLQGPLRLQMEENLQRLFSWKTGYYRFESNTVNIIKEGRISYIEEYSDIIKMLGSIEGSQLLEDEIFAQIAGAETENLYILPAGKSIGEANLQLNQVILKKVLEILKQHFDVIIMDNSPIEAQAGTVSLSPLADDIIFVIKSGKLTHKVLNDAKSTLPQEKIVGVILNQIKTNVSSSHYYGV
jgi:polysaccharide biosynthesis transport protein